MKEAEQGKSERGLDRFQEGERTNEELQINGLGSVSHGHDGGSGVTGFRTAIRVRCYPMHVGRSPA